MDIETTDGGNVTDDDRAMKDVLVVVADTSGTGLRNVFDNARRRERAFDEKRMLLVFQQRIVRYDYDSHPPSICRETEIISSGSGYPEEMLLLYGIRPGKHYDYLIIQTRDLSPVLQEMRKSAVCLVFCPLYYRDRSLGYVAMDLGNGIGSALYPVLMLLNGALMSLYLQTNLKRSAAIIERMAIEDIMTGMLNRRGYMERAPILLEQAKTVLYPYFGNTYFYEYFFLKDITYM